MVENCNYQLRFILFLDIIGFTEIINSTVDSENIEKEQETSRLLQVFEEIKTIEAKPKIRENWEVTMFSDSIVLSFLENDDRSISKFLFDVHRLFTKLLQLKIFFRGGISHGLLYHDKNVVFGPALISAYRLESTAAIYPRVIIEQHVVEKLGYKYSLDGTHDYRKSRWQSQVSFNLERDFDGLYYLDFFYVSLCFISPKEINDFYMNLRKVIIEGLSNSNSAIRSKYGWMKVKFNTLPNKFKSADESDDLFHSRPDIMKLSEEFPYIE